MVKETENEMPSPVTERFIDPQNLQPNTSPAPYADSRLNTISNLLNIYQTLLNTIEENKQAIHETTLKVNDSKQQIRELSSSVSRDPRIEDSQPESDIHTSKIVVQHDDCGTIIQHTEQIRNHIYDNVNEAATLLLPLEKNLGILKQRILYIQLLQTLLEQQKTGLQLEERQQNADSCFQQLASILQP